MAIWVLVGVWRPSPFSHFDLYSMENVPRLDVRPILKCVRSAPGAPLVRNVLKRAPEVHILTCPPQEAFRALTRFDH